MSGTLWVRYKHLGENIKKCLTHEELKTEQKIFFIEAVGEFLKKKQLTLFAE